MTDPATDTIRAVQQSADRALQDATARHRVPAWLLVWLVALERRRAGRFGHGGINTKFAEALENAAEGTYPSDMDASARRAAPPAAPEVQLRRLELKNFRQFPAAAIDFTETPGRPICVVEGDNGFGKSNLVEAIRWVLVDYREPSRNAVSLLHQHQDGDKAEVRVRVHLEVDGEAVEVWRTLAFVRRAAGFAPQGPATLTIRWKGAPEPLQDRDAEDWLSRRLPPEVLSYFIFDAESTVVAQLSGQAGERLPEVRTQVEAALGAQPVRDAAARCHDQARVWKKELLAIQGSHDAAGDRPVARPEDLDAPRRAEREATDEAARWMRRIQEISVLLGNVERSSGAREATQRERRRVLEREAARARDALRAGLAGDIALAIVCSTLPHAGTASGKRPSEALAEAVHLFARAVEAGAFPWARPEPAPRVRADLLSHLGFAVEDDPKVALALRAASARDRLTGAGADRLATMRRDLAALGPDLPEAEGDGVAERAASALRVESEQLVVAHGNAVAAAGSARARAAEIERSIRESEIVNRAAQRSRKEREALARRIEVAHGAAQALDEAADRIRDEGLVALERSASRVLSKTTNKPELFAGIRFEKDTLRYRVIDPDGHPVPPDPSTGERTVLALALVSGLQRASGLRFPLIMEALFKPLGPIHQDNVARVLLAERTEQTVLLLKPGELPPSLEHLVLTRVGQRLTIVRPHPGRSQSQIRPGPSP